MIELLLSIASEASVILRRDAHMLGIDDNALRRAVNAGLIIRIRQGAYAVATTWRAASSTEQHLMLVDAVMRQYAGHVALSHVSAALVSRAPGWGLDLRSVHLTHFEGSGRISAGVVHHHGSCRVLDVTRTNGHWITSPARTVHDIAMTASAEAALVNANDFLHRGLTTVDELRAFEPHRRHWPNTLGMAVVHHLADPRFESVAESRCIYLFWSQGLPLPEPQFEIYHPSGKFAGRVDFAWPEERVIVEFDGDVKYTKYLRDGETLEEAILREKRRESLIFELTGWRIIRLIWADLTQPAATASRIRQQFARAA